jgi:hypothetical protein
LGWVKTMNMLLSFLFGSSAGVWEASIFLLGN